MEFVQIEGVLEARKENALRTDYSYRWLTVSDDPAGFFFVALCFFKPHPSLPCGITVVQGKMKEAEPLHRRALEIAHKNNGPGHPAAASSLHGLAALAQARGGM